MSDYTKRVETDNCGRASPAGLIPDNGNRPMHLDNSHTIEIEADGLLIRMSNEIKPVLLKMLMDTLKESLC